MHACIHIHTHVRTYVRAYVNTYIRTRVHAYTRTYVHTYLPLRYEYVSSALNVSTDNTVELSEQQQQQLEVCENTWVRVVTGIKRVDDKGQRLTWRKINGCS